MDYLSKEDQIAIYGFGVLAILGACVLLCVLGYRIGQGRGGNGLRGCGIAFAAVFSTFMLGALSAGTVAPFRHVFAVLAPISFVLIISQLRHSEL